MVTRSPMRPAHSGGLDRVQERINQLSARDIKRNKYPSIVHIIMPQPDRRRTDAIPTLQAWPTANLALYMPFTIEQPCYFRSFRLTNGAGAGEADIRIYDGLTLAALTTSAAGALNGASTHVLSGVGFPLLQEGVYYLGISCSTNTYEFMQQAGLALGAAAGDLRLVDIIKQATAYPLPDTIGSTAAPSSALVPTAVMRLDFAV